MESEEKILGKYDVRVFVNWSEPIDLWTGKRYARRKALGFQKGFPATFIISESRVFLITEFTNSRVYTGIMVPVFPASKSKHRAFYMELALDKIVKYSFEKTKNYIIFMPHGQLGTTIIQFKDLPENVKKEIGETLGKARALNLRAPEAGILISDRAIREMFSLRWQIINAQRKATPTPISNMVAEPEYTQITIPLAKLKTAPNTGAASQEASMVTEIPETLTAPQQGSKLPLVEIEATGSSTSSEKVESHNFRRDEVKPETKQRLDGIWKSMVPRETICPYCKKRVFTIDKECPCCGAINL
ncbi:MAG: hypothetical protein WED07_15300 [Candidatus Freyarchaeum deiterrae]